MYLHFLGLISAVECILREYQNQRPMTTKENVTWSQPAKLIDHVAIGFFLHCLVEKVRQLSLRHIIERS